MIKCSCGSRDVECIGEEEISKKIKYYCSCCGSSWCWGYNGYNPDLIGTIDSKTGKLIK